MNTLNPLVGGGELAGLRGVGDAGADRIQVDIGHGGEYGALVAQRLALVASLPESSLAAVFAIGATGDGLDEAAHQPGEIAEALAQRLDPDGISQQPQTFGFDGGVAVLAGREKTDIPAPVGWGPGRGV